jgi:hypothetical protein
MHQAPRTGEQCKSMLRGPALTVPAEADTTTREALSRASSSYYRTYDATGPLAASRLEALQSYDITRMNRAVAVCHWGSSGSFLLASFLDGHPDVVLMPMLFSRSIYPFFQECGFLSLWEKLIAYPAYSAAKMPYGDFFLQDSHADGAVYAGDYYAAVHALFDIYGDRPAEWLDARLRFFQFVHIAYAVAADRHVEDERPLIVYAQHDVNQELAKVFIEDFPDGQFIHTIRDPITSFDSWADKHLGKKKFTHDGRPDLANYFLDSAVPAIAELLAWDHGNLGMGTRSRAVRFEDLHLATETTMRRLADWLGLPYRACLLESTWNGKPYVVNAGGAPWCGPNPAKAQRSHKNLNWADRLMIFALLHDNFAAWNYPFPKLLRQRWTRLGVLAISWLLPMKVELANAGLILRLQILPKLRRGEIGFALVAPFYLLKRRLRMALIIAKEARLRLLGRRALLKLL